MEQVLENVLNLIIDWTMRVTEYIGVIVLAVSVVRGLLQYIRKRPDAVKTMGRGMSASLSFLLAGEILRTVTIGSIYDIAIVAGIIALRTAIILLIHWEGKHSGREEEPHAAPHALKHTAPPPAHAHAKEDPLPDHAHTEESPLPDHAARL